MNRPRSPDAVVVGGGIVGLACARALAAEGLRVTVLERAIVGGGATAEGMGHAVVMDDSPAQLRLTAWSLALLRELAPSLPAPCEFDACGTLWLAEDEEDLALLPGKAELYRSVGVEAEILDARAVAEAEPRLRPSLAGGLRIPADAVLYPPFLAHWMAEELRAGGSAVEEGIEVAALEAGGVRLGSGLRISSPIVVNAAGIHAATLTPGLPIVPRRGHLLITDRRPGFCRHQLVELGYLKSAHSMGGESVSFNVQPRRTGQLLVGSSRELVGLDREPNRGLLSRMVRRAIDFLPGLASIPTLRGWIGFRPATPDSLPLLGRHRDGVWIAAGHEGLGITTALASGALLADLIAGRHPVLDPAPFDPNRSIGGEDFR